MEAGHRGWAAGHTNHSPPSLRQKAAMEEPRRRRRYRGITGWALPSVAGRGRQEASLGCLGDVAGSGRKACSWAVVACVGREGRRLGPSKGARGRKCSVRAVSPDHVQGHLLSPLHSVVLKRTWVCDAESEWRRAMLVVLPSNLTHWQEGTFGISTVQLSPFL